MLNTQAGRTLKRNQPIFSALGSVCHATQQSMSSHLFLGGGSALLSPSCVLSHVIMSFRLISAWLASATVCWEAASLLLGMARATVRAIAVTFLPGWPAATAPWSGRMVALQ